MVRSYITRQLITLLQRHIHDVNEKTLELAILSGTLKLENIYLKVENLQRYFNCKIDKIHVKKILLKFSILSLIYKPIEISCSGVTICVSREYTLTKNDFIFEKMRFIEDETEKMGKQKSLGSFAVRMFENAIIDISDVDFYYLYKECSGKENVRTKVKKNHVRSKKADVYNKLKNDEIVNAKNYKNDAANTSFMDYKTQTKHEDNDIKSKLKKTRRLPSKATNLLLDKSNNINKSNQHNENEEKSKENKFYNDKKNIITSKFKVEKMIYKDCINDELNLVSTKNNNQTKANAKLFDDDCKTIDNIKTNETKMLKKNLDNLEIASSENLKIDSNEEIKTAIINQSFTNYVINAANKIFSCHIDSIKTTDEDVYKTSKKTIKGHFKKKFVAKGVKIDYLHNEGRKKILDILNFDCSIIVNTTRDEPGNDFSIDLNVPEVILNIHEKVYKKIIKICNSYILLKKMKFTILNNSNFLNMFNTDIKCSKWAKMYSIYKDKDFNENDILNLLEDSKTYKEYYHNFTLNKNTKEENEFLIKFEEEKHQNLVLKLRNQVLKEIQLQPKRRFYFWTKTVTEEEKKIIDKEFDFKEEKMEYKKINLNIKFELIKLEFHCNHKTIKYTVKNGELIYNEHENKNAMVIEGVKGFYNKNVIIRTKRNRNFLDVKFISNKLYAKIENVFCYNTHVNLVILNMLLRHKIMTSEIKREKKFSLNFDYNMVLKNISYKISRNQGSTILFNTLYLVGNFVRGFFKLEDFEIIMKKNTIVETILDKTNFSSDYNLTNNMYSANALLTKLNINLEESINLYNKIYSFLHILKYKKRRPDEKKNILDINLFNITLELRGINLFSNALMINNVIMKFENNALKIEIKKISYNGILIEQLKITYTDFIYIDDLSIECNLKEINILKLINDLKLPNIKSRQNTLHTNLAVPAQKNITYKINNINIIFKDKFYSIKIREIINSNFYTISINFDETAVQIEHVNIMKNSIIVSNIIGTKVYSTIDTLYDIFSYLKLNKILPLTDSKRDFEMQVVLRNILINDTNLTTYNKCLLKSKKCEINIYLEKIECLLDVLISENISKSNILEGKLKITKSNGKLDGSSKLTGILDNEFYRTLIHIFLGAFDLIGIIISHMFDPSNDVLTLSWSIYADLSLYNYINSQFLISLCTDIDLCGEIGLSFNMKNFINGKNFYKFKENEFKMESLNEIFKRIEAIEHFNKHAIESKNEKICLNHYFDSERETLGLSGFKLNAKNNSNLNDKNSNNFNKLSNINYELKNEESQKFYQEINIPIQKDDTSSNKNLEVQTLISVKNQNTTTNRSYNILYEAFNEFRVTIKKIKSIDVSEKIILSLEDFNMVIFKQTFGCSILLKIDNISLFIETHKILMLKHSFLTPNISFDISGISQEVVIDMEIKNIKFKNILISNLSIFENIITFGLEKIEMATDEQIYDQMLKGHNNFISPPFYNYLTEISRCEIRSQISHNLNSYFITIDNIVMNQVENYEFLQIFVFSVFDDLEFFRLNSKFYDDKPSVLNVATNDCSFTFYDQLIISITNLSIIQTFDDKMNDYSIFLGQGEIFSYYKNQLFLENTIFSIQYQNKTLTMNSFDCKGMISKAMIIDETRKKASISNFTDLKIECIYKGKIYSENIFFSINAKENEEICFQISDKINSKQESIFIRNETFMILFNSFFYILEPIVKKNKITFKFMHNIIFKNYTEYQLNFYIGNENMSNNEYYEHFILRPFEDHSLKPKYKESLFAKLKIDEWGMSPDLFKFFDGTSYCQGREFTIKSKLKGKFLFFIDDHCKIICVDLIIAKKDGIKTFYILLYPQNYLYNATSTDFRFNLRNIDLGVGSVIDIKGINLNESKISNSVDTYSHLSNVIGLPFSSGDDIVKLVFTKINGNQDRLLISRKNRSEDDIEYSEDIKYKVKFVVKERLIHSKIFISDLCEIIIFPFYIINNFLNKDIYLGNIFMKKGENQVYLKNTRLKVIYDEFFRSKNEIEFYSIELFIVLKLRHKKKFVDVFELYTKKHIFGDYKKKKSKHYPIKLNNAFKSEYIYDIVNKGCVYKNIAVEIKYGKGKYSETKIVNIKYANILYNNTCYAFMIISENTIYIVKPKERIDIHFGKREYFYIYFFDEFGFTQYEDCILNEPYQEYFCINDKLYTISSCDREFLRRKGKYIPITGISYLYFRLNRKEMVLFKLKLNLQGKQRLLEIQESNSWPIEIHNTTNYIYKFKQKEADIVYCSFPTNRLNYCFDELYKPKKIELTTGKINLEVSLENRLYEKSNVMVFVYQVGERTVIEISDRTRTPIVYEIFKLNVEISNLALSILSGKEIMCLHFKNINYNMRKYIEDGENKLYFELLINAMQIDDQDVFSRCPVIMYPKSKLMNVLYDKSHKGKEFLRIMLEIGKEDTFNVCNEIIDNIKIGDLNNTSSFNNGTSNDNVLENNYDNHNISHNYKFNSNKNSNDSNNVVNTDRNGINNTKNGSVENSINDSNISI
ncbi:hypothetical protein COBT_001771, partial [Conglomerata obtusa]